MGKLQEMMDKQATLQLRLGTNFNTLTIEERVAFIKEHSIHATQEIHEMLYELPFFKPWKDYSGMSEASQVKGMTMGMKEYVDFFHFTLNMGIALGFDEELLYQMYMEKNSENHKRQDEGYTHEKQYR